jgi:hypothetical protein
MLVYAITTHSKNKMFRGELFYKTHKRPIFSLKPRASLVNQSFSGYTLSWQKHCNQKFEPGESTSKWDVTVRLPWTTKEQPPVPAKVLKAQKGIPIYPLASTVKYGRWDSSSYWPCEKRYRSCCVMRLQLGSDEQGFPAYSKIPHSVLPNPQIRRFPKLVNRLFASARNDFASSLNPYLTDSRLFCA